MFRKFFLWLLLCNCLGVSGGLRAHPASTRPFAKSAGFDSADIMPDHYMSDKKGFFGAKVLSNKATRKRYWRLNLELDAAGSQLFLRVKPGQFAEFDLVGVSLPPVGAIPAELRDAACRQIILRRPFSFSDVKLISDSPPAVSVEVLYRVAGPATLRMTTLKPDDLINIIGPLGNGFAVPAGKNRAILIAGGMGSPPLQHLAEYLRAHHPDTGVVVFAGARSLDDFPFTVQVGDDGSCVPVEFARLGDRACVATDDGSAGFHGLVTELAAQWLDENSPDAPGTIIYGCGPEVMLAAVAGLAAAHGIDCQVSMERMMACGIGLCQSCAVLTAPDAAGETMYKLCCKDGPVFDSKDVSFRL